MGKTEVGTATKRSEIAMANTANTSHMSKMIKIRNKIRTLPFRMVAEISATLFPFSFTLITKEPKSCTAPINTAPSTTQSIAGNHPQ